MKASQGDIWFADFGEPVGREQGYARPALVISNDAYNTAGFGLVIAAPLTTRDRGWSNHVEVPLGGTGLRTTSWVMVQQVRSLSTMRMKARLGQAPDHVLDKVLTLLEQML
ncbi:type II toxin-antitoxin system PemK/MazF family toxin [Planotetraspora sp. A-T 1434]|uniref:type II toxin-antitoxin system PemK/MazF family toxin n=1 Tax=Planotetraspora sp. A-T 1434 TaxID=2979219 RepID=UPI0021C24847|nr:type II toxin-antitoxin system PemK/MazF family toxin [Planotetraspora sp. A-T 1434]MCT9929494.1 type II toxin-antitoxin system PemK/MazF family toxin [Planotetraspora sp. A-T 1434]